MTTNDAIYLTTLADALDEAPRQGKLRDKPEGSRTVALSDTLARSISSRLREMSNGAGAAGVR